MYFSGSNLEGCVWAGFRGWVDQGDIIKTGSKTHVRRERTMSFVYSVKFICGVQNLSTTCTSVRPGAYATEIDIHNFHQPLTSGPPPPPAHITKRLLLLVHNNQPVGREPGSANAQNFATITLQPDTATMDDCCNLLGPNFTANGPLNIGFLELVSDVPVSVTAVYTANDVTASGAPGTAISIDVQSITPQQA
jgi:hypothetical protein